MGRRGKSDYRTWLLLVLALVPTWSVLGLAGWMWSERGEQIQAVADSLVPVQTTFELSTASSALLRAEASLRAAALPGASDELIRRAGEDTEFALQAVVRSETALVPLIEQVSQNSDPTAQEQVLSFIGSSLSMTTSLLESQTPGEPTTPEMGFIISLARDNGSGQVLPFTQSGWAEADSLYNAMAATILYHDQFDRDRSTLLAGLESDESADKIDVAQITARDSRWQELVDSRNFAATAFPIRWQTTSRDPDSPLLVDRAEPLTAAINELLPERQSSETSEFFLAVQEIDRALADDLGLAYDRLIEGSQEHVASLTWDRTLMAAASALTAILALALAALTLLEVRQRRRVEVAHDKALSQLGEKARRDSTTGAWNRRHLEEVAPALIEQASKSSTEEVILAYVDLDHFKAINDVWGHQTGDEVLRIVTRRLTGFSYDGIDFALCRFGGDEFVLTAKDRSRPLEWLEELGRNIISAVDTRMDVKGRRHEVGASVGIATSNADSTLDSLLLEADSSLILAKRERGTFVVYNRTTSRTGELVHALPSALANDEVCAHVQPVVDGRTGAIVHVEALARWNRGSGEVVGPSVFVPLVESYGLAEELTTNMLRSLHRMFTSGDTPPGVRVWINVSPRELDVSSFSDRFVTILNSLGLSPNRIGLEIIETAAVRDPERLAVELRRLSEIGIKVAIDDFGSGYSPLGYLRSLPVDTVKIDRSLISHIDADTANQHLVHGVVGMVHHLGMNIVAEGVERPEERQWLLDNGIHLMQGFLFGAAEPLDHFDWGPRALPAEGHDNLGIKIPARS